MAFDAVASIAAQWEVLGEDGVIRSIQNMAKKSKSALDPRAITDSWNAVLPKVGEKFRDTLKTAIKGGLDLKTVAKFTESFGDIKKKMADAVEEVSKIESKLAMENITDREKKELKARLKTVHREIEARQGGFALEMRHIERVARRREEAVRDASEILNRNMAEGVEAFGEGLESAFSKVQGGDFGGLMKGMGKGMAGRGQAMQQGKMAQMKGIGPMVKSMGSLMTKLGPIIMGLGAVVGAIGAVMAIVAAADSQVKGFNKSLLEGGVQMGDLMHASEGAEEAITGISQGFSKALAHNRAWGITAQENLDILAAYGAGGLTIRELAHDTDKAADRMVALKKATEAALGYSKLLGVSSAEVAANFADYMEELGMTLHGIQQRFSGIYSAAMESGFGIKRFYNMVLQATSGMSMYNVRLEEAASLLIHLGRILGQKMSGDFLQSLVQGFRDEDTLTRTQKVMKRGVEETLSDGRAGATEGARELLRKIADFKEADSVKGGKLEKMLVDKVELTLEQAADPAQLAQAMSKMTQKQVGELTVEMKTLGETGVGISRSMEDVYGKSMAHRGGLGGAQATRQYMDPGMVLWNRLNAAKGVTGKRLDQTKLDDTKMRAAFESVAGETGQSAEELMRIGRTFQGYHSQLSKAQEEMKGKSLADRQAIAAEFNDQFGKTIGVGLSDEGKRMKYDMEEGKVTDEAFGEDFRSFFLKMGDEFTKDDDKVEEDIALAREIASSTTELSLIMKQGVEYFLSLIYDAVSWIASFFGPAKLTDKEKVARGEATQQMQDKLEETRQLLRDKSVEMSELEREGARSGTSAERKEEITRMVDHLKENIIPRLEGSTKVQETSIRSIRTMGVDEVRKIRQDGGSMRAGEWRAAGTAAKRSQSVVDAELAKLDPDYEGNLRMVGAEASLRGSRAVSQYGKDSWNPTKGYHMETMSSQVPELAESVQSDYRASQVAQQFGVDAVGKRFSGEKPAWYSAGGWSGGEDKGIHKGIDLKEIATKPLDKTLETLEQKAERQGIKLHKKGGLAAKGTEWAVFEAMTKLKRQEAAVQILQAMQSVGLGMPAHSDMGRWSSSLVKGDGAPADLKELMRSTPGLQEALTEKGIYTEKIQDAIVYQDDKGNLRHLSMARGDVAKIGPMDGQGGGRTSGGGSGITIHNHFPSDKAVASVRRFMEHDIRYVRG